ncbi:TPA: XRE family transcriptional regulator [Streptococcus suis]|uniref:XRE family transcriptional regulator n=1 Tax=Streptococcus suis TaxID=1307 RepID=UPI002117CBE2|nr:XRE family transcriptional regulator [Streptococcus suis]HEL1645265.1 XRE family transcriptional regulator [Streptococcus suis]HEL2593586.1 XRE family transcriptional regulator [Streptococcus suis]HEM4717539.1 XRE family transcriptional regulator [Streptococcus suis]HEM4776259.1 XRE family transcriptional regulator [Streptococcus suis]
MTNKEKVRSRFLLPKKRLREERKKRELTTLYMADLIGLKNRRQYELKEKGQFPFQDYEMAIISKEFGMSETDLFFSW